MGRKKKGRVFKYEKGKMMEQSAISRATIEQNGLNFGLIIPDECYRKIMHWINKSDFEVSGFGSLDFDQETGIFTVRDVILLKQEVGPASTEISPEALNRAMFQQRDQVNPLKWHWHSHVNMGVFWSQDDRELIRNLGQRGWILATVFNKREESKTAFLTSTTVLGRPHDLFVDDIQTRVLRSVSEELVAQCDAEYAACVTDRVQSYVGFPEYGSLREDKPIQQAFEMDHHHRRSPRPRKISPSEYDKGGFAKVQGVPCYNPVYDEDIKTQDEMFMMIADMRPEEIDFMQEACPVFKQNVQAYYASLAADRSATHQGLVSEGDLEDKYADFLAGEDRGYDDEIRMLSEAHGGRL